MASVEVRNVVKTYKRDAEELRVLDGLSLSIPDGAFVALMGPSGSGKTTLLNLIGGVTSPAPVTSRSPHEYRAHDRCEPGKWRSASIGYIFQTYNLIPVLTALENVELPLLLVRMNGAERRKRATTALELVGLGDRLKHYPRQLSGGQEQRVAIARALVSTPRCCSPTSPPVISTASPPRKCSTSSTAQREFKKTIVMVTPRPARLAAGLAPVPPRQGCPVELTRRRTCSSWC
jgi:putative ABC transport system ATP-binding protein